jgi:hypothetical protein
MSRPAIPEIRKVHLNVTVPASVKRGMRYLAAHQQPPVSMSVLVTAVLLQYCFDRGAIWPDGGEQTNAGLDPEGGGRCGEADRPEDESGGGADG